MIKLMDILKEVLERGMVDSFDITKDQLKDIIRAAKDEPREGLGMAVDDWIREGGTIESIADDMWEWFFTKDFPKGFRNVPNPIPLKRYITAPSKEDIDLDNIGESWFAVEGYGFDQAMDHLTHRGKPSGHKKFLVTAKVPMRNVNIPLTIMVRNIKSYENEFIVERQEGIHDVKINEV